MPVGPRNLITDVPGLTVGNADDHRVRSGVTVVLPDRACPAAVDVRGGGPGTAETDLLAPSATVPQVDALVLSGGSAFGLEARAGVVGWLASQGRGFEVAGTRVPIVPSAILFDLINGGDKDWGETPPYRALGRQAAVAASHDFPLGNVGAGLGAKAGALKGGLGSASWVLPDGTSVGALVAVNALGSAVEPESGAFWAWILEQEGEFGGYPPPARPVASLDATVGDAPPQAGANTTIAVVATDARLDKVGCGRLAVMAQDGLARALRPVHSPLDGDTVFALSTGQRPGPDVVDLARLGRVAADCLARAVARGVWAADSLGPYPAWRERYGAAAENV
ncbi:P1 family peptidase [Aquibaculum arenosum]|uniref:P1 family peptidase n=1 Tax=Aquibaculum arenosum TaxID=3032591 RepID=A0ABT5YR73_9PROT|nr:P1 family peptidase [Fodinicurvata sp. CAU 1616]MDF2097240.1 P1 family peptidase [Fodinicurvata sp. CAU 1616]